MRMAIEPDKYVPELHRVLLSTLDELVNQIEFDESLSFSVMMPIIMATRMLEPGNTLEQGGLCLCQIAHCCRVMGALDNAFYRSSPLFVHYLQAISELGHHLDWYPSAITRWQNFAKGHSLQ
ncbi:MULTISPECIES: hypothetical protein [Vibrio harveyi group]|uniref:Uncharacterized protein n=2 Tax=Vibrio parahaemolyticus TaxID=670 RepID=A0A7Y0S151_VIBPH|nr:MULTISPECIES: hypothetical protein [Vibrio harveyi group]ARR48068.1 hypothetical protein CAY59_28075 [Vibrio campbellii]EGQ8535499.1 hypothetical protein [Vibrio parahaemolyticus]EHC7291092.1 hypothetical protein [Vibrio parahaemolyticus]EJA7342225.1 hypothetical protein [Vibrio parahaemolyticus]EJB8409508.1 hypothetical protein [Vibrio parahaemolyticus]